MEVVLEPQSHQGYLQYLFRKLAIQKVQGVENKRCMLVDCAICTNVMINLGASIRVQLYNWWHEQPGKIEPECSDVRMRLQNRTKARQQFQSNAQSFTKAA